MSIMSIWFVAYNYSMDEGCFDVINVIVNRASTIFSLTHWALKRLHCHILPKWIYWSTLLRKWKMTCLLPHPENERPLSLNEFWPCILQNPESSVATLTHNRTIGRVSRQKWLPQQCYYVLTMSVNGVNNLWPCILENPMAVRRH